MTTLAYIAGGAAALGIAFIGLWKWTLRVGAEIWDEEPPVHGHIRYSDD